MKKRLFVFIGIVFLLTGSLTAKEPLKDYSFIRGVCHNLTPDQATLDRDLGFMDRLQLNSTRVWLSQRAYESNPEEYINTVINYIRTCNKHGVTVMPILFSSGGFPAVLQKGASEGCEKYVTAIVNALKNEEGLLMWDVCNEPNCNDYYRKAPPEEKQKRNDEIAAFLRHFITFVKKIDPVNAVTVGHWIPKFCENTNDLVDVISFHDYLETRSRVEASYALAEEFSKKYNKPLINSELCCICRSNPYDMAIQIADEHNVGIYIFNLIISGGWSDVHGLVYPDGTIRDPSIIAALFGFYRNRDLNTTVKALPNREEHAEKAIALLEEVLAGDFDEFPDVFGIEPFRATKSSVRPMGNRPPVTSVDDILEAAEYCANLLEGAEMVPMREPPTAKIETWRKMSDEDKEKARGEIRNFAYDLALQLKEWCELF
ncbi:MAG: cellulase family glycosylhydrolase [Bacteroidales bacterium]|nr:cellulase family glycosylhydrolase [Bacteroidales bacterium]